DVVSGGELFRALQAGADPSTIAFAGVGKTDSELAGALDSGVGWINAETSEELAVLNRLAGERACWPQVALRLNPDVAAHTHRHIRTGAAGDKFGFPAEGAGAILRRPAAYPALRLHGLHLHIGSQIPRPEETLQAIEAGLALIRHLPAISMLDIGGGFPVPYSPQDNYPPIEAFAAPIVERLRRPDAAHLQVQLEPGRFLVADAGALVVRVLAVKQAGDIRTIIVDVGMNVLLRPALYGATHAILPLNLQHLHRTHTCPGRTPAPDTGAGGCRGVQVSPIPDLPSAVAGPICESADYLSHAADLPADLQRGDRLAVLNAGAYGMTMASNYNSHPLPAEVMVDGGEAHLIRRRQTYKDLITGEELL
ncbi:MAG: diaminopimelate decarboxylase, partial [Chloroflexi bacterium]|nr:diaminopimelate decarboxylase [Chloroflexota bacterium]